MPLANGVYEARRPRHTSPGISVASGAVGTTIALFLRLGRALTSCLALLGATACSKPCESVAQLSFRAPEQRAYRQDAPAPHQTVAVIGDLQRTSSWGCSLGNEVNDDEQEQLLSHLGGQAPGAVVLLGDMVFRGDDARHWAYFDHLIQRAGLEDVSLLPLLGNHDYMFAPAPALRHVRRRFGRLQQRTYYAFSWGGVRMLLFDANRRELGQSAWQRQLEWLDCELDAADRGCSRGVLLFAHQSPFTQSPWAPNDRNLLRDVVPRFCESRRKLGFISAHAHGYERWYGVPVAGCRERGTPFIVSAGGGGPRPPQRRTGATPDDASLAEWPRPFNYLLLAQSMLESTSRYTCSKREKAGCGVPTPKA